MKFTLESASYDNIFEQYPQIVENFKTEKEHIERAILDFEGRPFVYEDDIFYIKISTLVDILKLRELIKADLIVTDDCKGKTMYKIIIYDGYIE